jgi:hypothetical protein
LIIHLRSQVTADLPIRPPPRYPETGLFEHSLAWVYRLPRLPWFHFDRITTALLYWASSFIPFANVWCFHLLILPLIGPADLLVAVFLFFSALLVDLTGSGRPRENPRGDGAQAVFSQAVGLPFMTYARRLSRPCCMNYFR